MPPRAVAMENSETRVEYGWVFWNQVAGSASEMAVSNAVMLGSHHKPPRRWISE